MTVGTLLGEVQISTHAPLAGRDNGQFIPHPATWLFQPTRPLRGATALLVPGRGRDAISTHAPLAGRDWNSAAMLLPGMEFQPTRPLRGATGFVNSAIDAFKFQPTRPLRGATLLRGCWRGLPYISTHAPLAGRDGRGQIGNMRGSSFQPTRPLRGATARVYKSLCTFLR